MVRQISNVPISGVAHKFATAIPNEPEMCRSGNWGEGLRACLRGLNAYLRWIGFFQICTSGECSTPARLDAHIRRRLRASLLRQWKTKRTVVRRLIRLGVSAKTA